MNQQKQQDFSKEYDDLMMRIERLNQQDYRRQNEELKKIVESFKTQTTTSS